MLAVATEFPESLIAEVESDITKIQEKQNEKETEQGNKDILIILKKPVNDKTIKEVEGVILAFKLTVLPDGHTDALLVRAPEAVSPETSAASASGALATRGSPLPPLSDGRGVPISVVLLVVMPNPRTNLRFDYASDPLTLSDDATRAHAEAEYNI